MSISRRLGLSAAALLFTSPLAAHEPQASQAEIEAQMPPLVQFIGEEDQRPTLEERRAQLGIHGLSLAFFRAGELAWADAYGEDVDTDTLFQAASLSKPVAAAGIIALAAEHGVSLDADISADLAGLDLARVNPEGLPITLRGLLSHTSGAGVSGFPGYRTDAPLPTTLQVIEGSEPANTETVVLSSGRAGAMHYSGGGYTIAQYWAEQVSGEEFPALMRRLVLDPLGMERSLFAALPPEALPRDNVARAHYPFGTMAPGGWHAYPEHAAASLWSTPREYGRFALALVKALGGDAHAGIAPETARAMASPVGEGYGLGLGVEVLDDGTLRIGHSGSNMGFKANFGAFAGSGDAFVAMTDTANGWVLLSEVGRSAAAAYGWPAQAIVERERLPASDQEMERLAGRYQMEGGVGPVVTIAPAGKGEMRGALPNGRTFRLVRIGEDRWIDPEDAQEIVFAPDAEGRMTVRQDESVFIRQ